MTAVLYDRILVISDEADHQIELITDPNAGVIEETQWHLDSIRPAFVCNHDFEVAMDAADALDIRAQVLACFEEGGATIVESILIDMCFE